MLVLAPPEAIECAQPCPSTMTCCRRRGGIDRADQEVCGGARGFEGPGRARSRPPSRAAGRDCTGFRRGAASPTEVILVDTSVWVDHIRRGDAPLIRMLDEGQVLTHPFVVGEVAMGNLPRRRLFLDAMRRLPRAQVATDAEAMSLMEREHLYGRGIGFADLHLLAATRLTPHATLWSRDRRLRSIAEELGLASSPD